MHAWEQRLLGLRRCSRLRDAPELHGSGGSKRLYVQRRSRVQHNREHVRELDHFRCLLEGLAGLRLSIGEFSMPFRLLWRKLHGRLHTERHAMLGQRNTNVRLERTVGRND